MTGGALARIAGVFALVAVGCGGRGAYRGEGDVIAIDEPGPLVTIAHDEIPGLMAAMTMRFTVQSRAVMEGVTTGTRVRFGLDRAEQGFVLTWVEVLGPARNPIGTRHDHSPQHGGIVVMTNTVHVEAFAVPDGRIRVWLTDLMRAPLPPTAAEGGTVTVRLPDGPQSAPLAIVGDHLEAVVSSMAGNQANVRVQMRHRGEQVDVNFQLPLIEGAIGTAAVQVGGCTPPTPPTGYEGRVPACTMTLSPAPTRLVPLGDGETLLMARGEDVAAWTFPAARVLRGFAPLPEEPQREPSNDHRHHPPNLIVVRPDRAETVVTSMARMVRYDVSGGRVLAELPRAGGFVAAAAWLPDGRVLAIGLADEGQVRLVDGTSGAPQRVLGGEGLGPIAVILPLPDGAQLVAGTDFGQVVVWDLRQDAPPRVLKVSHRPIGHLGVAGDRVVAAGMDGHVRAFATGTWAPLFDVDVGSSITCFALDPSRALVATGGRDQRLRVHRATDGAVEWTSPWHATQLFALAFAGQSLVSTDGDGVIAVWPLAVGGAD